MKEIKFHSKLDTGNRVIYIYSLYETTPNEPFIDELGNEQITYNRIPLEVNCKLISDRVPETDNDIIAYIKSFYNYTDWIN